MTTLTNATVAGYTLSFSGKPLKQRIFAVATASVLTILASGCDDGTPPEPSTSTVADADKPSATLPEGQPPILTEEQLRGERGAEQVLQEWARALERGDYNRAYAQFGDAGAASGMSRGDHEARWSQFKQIEVTSQPGVMEGAAGTSYYRAPVQMAARRIDGTPVTRSGEVTLARVNDVPGATPAQLRWHLVTSELTKSL